ncbi:helix-turn-helix transcriptional regulator [Streptosporangium sp. NPDC006013]|uniref:helix-turn-helix domain-containing protein n=1 Tax=Streptosporangium sp. NPDC006013 TaxID=3155596 RepID=UPI0033AC5622
MNDLPVWAVRLRGERRSRDWSLKDMARHLVDAAGDHSRDHLPTRESLIRMIRSWEAGKHRPSEPYPQLFARAFGVDEADLFGEPDAHPRELSSLSDEAIDLAAWIEKTNVGNSTITMLDEATHCLAEHHTRIPPRRMLADVTRVHRQTRALLRGGKQRLHQTRELLRIDADLLAHACILLGDLHDDEAAIVNGMTAVLCADEADSNMASALSAQAKTERWRRRYAVSADVARRGFDCSPPTPVRTLLAGQEANAAGLLGDFGRAREALRRAEDAAATVAADSGLSPWSCPRPRQTLFMLSVALRAGDPEEALRAAEMADAAWASGEPYVFGTWAQIRFGAANAYVMMGDLHGAAGQIAPVMSMPPELRMATVTYYPTEMDARLQDRRFYGSEIAASLREQIREFNSAALSAVVEGDV